MSAAAPASSPWRAIGHVLLTAVLLIGVAALAVGHVAGALLGMRR